MRHTGVDKPFLVMGSDYHDTTMDSSWADFLPRRQHRPVGTAFFQRFLRGIPSPLLAGPSPTYPEVEVRTTG